MASTATLNQLLMPLGDCLTPESAEKLVNLQDDKSLQERIHELGKKSGAGELTAEERNEYEIVVQYTNFVSILQSKARKLLRNS